MGRLVIASAIAGVMFSCSSVSIAADPDEQELVSVWVTDFSGKPPFKRELKQLPAADIAALEIDLEEVETERVWSADFSGRPPFKRRFRDLPVIDASSLEVLEEENAPGLTRSKSGFKRHR